MAVYKASEHVTGITFKKLYTVSVWAVKSDDGGYLLVDTGFNGSDVEGELNRAGFNGPPKAIVLTHCHLDHCGNAARLAGKWGVPVIASAEETPLIDGSKKLSQYASGPLRSTFFKLLGLLKHIQADAVEVTRTVKDGDLIDGVEVISIPGHTPGQIALFQKDDGACISADCFMNMKNNISHDPISLIDIDREAAVRSMRRVAGLKAKVILPSHGPALREDGSERITKFLREKHGM